MEDKWIVPSLEGEKLSEKLKEAKATVVSLQTSSDASRTKLSKLAELQKHAID